MMKARLIRRMVGDRETKYKRDAALKQRSGGSSAENWSELADLVKNMKKKHGVDEEILETVEQEIFKEASREAKPIENQQVDDDS